MENSEDIELLRDMERALQEARPFVTRWKYSIHNVITGKHDFAKAWIARVDGLRRRARKRIKEARST